MPKSNNYRTQAKGYGLYIKKSFKKSRRKNVGVFRKFITFVTSFSFPKRKTFFSNRGKKFPKTGKLPARRNNHTFPFSTIRNKIK